MEEMSEDYRQLKEDLENVLDSMEAEYLECPVVSVREQYGGGILFAYEAIASTIWSEEEVRIAIKYIKESWGKQ